MNHVASVPVNDIREVEENIVSCDGGGLPSGHPRVFLKIHPVRKTITCPYCSRRYLLPGQTDKGSLST